MKDVIELLRRIAARWKQQGNEPIGDSICAVCDTWEREHAPKPELKWEKGATVEVTRPQPGFNCGERVLLNWQFTSDVWTVKDRASCIFCENARVVAPPTPPVEKRYTGGARFSSASCGPYRLTPVGFINGRWYYVLLAEDYKRRWSSARSLAGYEWTLAELRSAFDCPDLTPVAD